MAGVLDDKVEALEHLHTPSIVLGLHRVTILRFAPQGGNVLGDLCSG